MKKISKYVLGILWLLLTIFLLAGFFVPTVKYEASTTVDLPLETTFQRFNDKTLMPTWMPEIQKITPLKETPNKIGSRYIITINAEGNVVEMTEETLDYQENKHVKIALDVESMFKIDDFTFEENNGTTTITQRVEAKGSGYINRCFFAFMKNAFRKVDQQYLDNFKAFATQK